MCLFMFGSVGRVGELLSADELAGERLLPRVTPKIGIIVMLLFIFPQSSLKGSVTRMLYLEFFYESNPLGFTSLYCFISRRYFEKEIKKVTPRGHHYCRISLRSHLLNTRSKKWTPGLTVSYRLYRVDF